MASVTIIGVHIALASDPSNELHFTKVDLTPEVEMPGQFEVFANGVVRLMKGSGKLRTIEAEIRSVTREQRETLDSWEGELLLWRDSRGRILFGSFLSLGGPDKRGSQGLADLSLAFTATTHSIEV